MDYMAFLYDLAREAKADGLPETAKKIRDVVTRLVNLKKACRDAEECIVSIPGLESVKAQKLLRAVLSE